MRATSKKDFSIILTGVGGQGIITLISLIDEAAFVEGYDIRSSELHGLSQRGGSVEAHVRFGLLRGKAGNKVYSPLVENGKADLIIALELLEGLRESVFAGKQTKILVNDYHLIFPGSPEKKAIEEKLKALSDNLFIVPASQACKEKLNKEVVSAVYLLGWAVYNNLIPLKEESVLKAIKKIIPQKYQELNTNAFILAKSV